MGDDVGNLGEGIEHSQARFISKKSPDYRLEYINGALSNITPRGDIVCDFHFEFKDMPMEQIATIIGEGKATLLPFSESNMFTRDIKFGIIMNVQFAKDLVRLLNDKINEVESKAAKSKKDAPV